MFFRPFFQVIYVMIISMTEPTEMITNKMILFGYRGSITYSMYISDAADIDLIGVYIQDFSHYFGFPKKDHQVVTQPPYDITNYELRKFVSLLMKGNPNVLSLLWTPEKFLLHATGIGKMLIDNRDLFVSKSCYNVFKGYARSQETRMTKVVDTCTLGAKRKALVEQFGYDTKNAAHSVRLLRMGAEFLRDGVLQVDRSNIDSDELLDIKTGKWKLEDVKALVRELTIDLDSAYSDSDLPERVDHCKIETLLINMLSKYFAITPINF